ncbi:MAG TPA: hypothetical protein VMT70_08120 [Vicinamibacteria bacterium]|nr:hypothetical protein [Vicinamibacteria bacterium]
MRVMSSPSGTEPQKPCTSSAAPRRVGAHVPVEGSDQLTRPQPARHERAHAPEERGHEQRRRQALARDVADDHRETLVVEVDDVVEVAADGPGRPHPRLDDHVALAEDFARHEVELDPPCRLEIAPHLGSEPETPRRA